MYKDNASKHSGTIKREFPGSVRQILARDR
jgi:hypothetical protein